MTRSWEPDRGWTGTWDVPHVLRHPITPTERDVLVALSRSGYGPQRLAASLSTTDSVMDLADEVTSGGATIALDRLGIRAIVPSDVEYPAELSAIDSPPLLLYARGRRLDELRPAVGIVGARACTSGAARFARRLGEAFANAGFTVVSGLARGIDGAAHHGAVEAGSTVAVLGSGIDFCYPKEHQGLYDRIALAGAIVSEFPPAVEPRPWHFPARNRIIAGVCASVIVVEAGLKSGALITAAFALDYGRDVLACTTGPENPAGAGVRELLLDGATLIVDPHQAVASVLDSLGRQDFAFGEPAAPRERAMNLSDELLRIYEAVTEDCTIDDIATNARLPQSRVASGLAELELEGVVDTSNGHWRRT